MVLPMVSSKINKKVTLSHDNLYKNIQMEFLKCLYISPPLKFRKIRFKGGYIVVMRRILEENKNADALSHGVWFLDNA